VRRSALLAAGLLLIALAGSARAGAAQARFAGDVTDALRVPAHRLVAHEKSGRAAGDLVFVDRHGAKTAVRTCVVRRDVHWRICFTTTTGAAGVATVTPLHFRRGSYVVHWAVGATRVARWRFDVV
jgi:hypothetical protein